LGQTPTHKISVYLVPHTHAHTHKTETKRTTKIKTKKIVLKKPKKGGKENNRNK
jgi:hypothetical protein